MLARRIAVVAAIAAAGSVAGCGSSTLSAPELRTRAIRICDAAAVRAARIAMPSVPAQGESFLSAGVSALAPELAALRRLAPPGDLSDEWRRALTATADELSALEAAVVALRAGHDPVNEIKTLQRRLAPLETTANAAWRTLRMSACASQ